MIKFFKNKRGETILETVIAVSILAIGVTLSSTLMASSLRNMNSSKSRVIAVNIAREGIEAVRNIRDTNWLKYSSQLRECWNHMPQDITDDVTCYEPCDGENPIPPGDYIVYKAEGIGGNSDECNSIQRWRLAPKGDIGVAPDNVTNTLLYQVDIEPTAIDTNGDGIFDNDKDIYNHKINTDDNANGNDAVGRKNAQSTNFFRTITIEYLENSPSPTDSSIDTIAEWASADKKSLNRMRVTCKVTWIHGERESSVELKTILTDYFGRDDLDS
ncbi:hypothetical protein JW758_04515 [Candidatus Peregrinibacteria bacterium]|nr:hypothetical protein [Candidatus Peregrinibacteria bacterium]